MTVVCVPTNEIRNAWSKVKPLLLPAIERSGGRWTSEYVLASLVLGEQTLWVIVNDKSEIVGTATVEITSYPERRMLSIHFLGGENFDKWYEELLNALSEYGKGNMCAGIECNARAGFWKWFESDGFKRPSVFYEKAL